MATTTGTSTTTNQFSPYIQKMVEDYLAQAQTLAGQPYVPYGGQRVAPLTPQHQQAIDLATQRGTQGAPDINAARSMTTDFTGGAYLNNPYLAAGTPYAQGANAAAGFAGGAYMDNPAFGANTPFGQAGNLAGSIMGGQYMNNPFISPEYTNRVIADNADYMARTFAQGTAAQNDAAANRAGAYGGSGWANKQTADAEALARATGAMGNQYQLAAQTLGAGDYRSGVSQLLQGGNLGASLGQIQGGDYRSGAGQALQGAATAGQLGLGAAGVQQGATGQMLTAGQLAGNLSQDDYRRAQALAGAGDIARDPAQQQADFAYQEFLRQQQWPYQQTNFLGSAIGNAAGGQGTTTTTQSQPGSSDWMNYLGLGLGLGGLLL